MNNLQFNIQIIFLLGCIWCSEEFALSDVFCFLYSVYKHAYVICAFF